MIEPFMIPKLLRAAVTRKDLPMLKTLLEVTEEITARDVGLAFMDAAEIDWEEGTDVLLATGVPLAFLLCRRPGAAQHSPRRKSVESLKHIRAECGKSERGPRSAEVLPF
jgi:hypothetical protein